MLFKILARTLLFTFKVNFECTDPARLNMYIRKPFTHNYQTIDFRHFFILVLIKVVYIIYFFHNVIL